MKSFREVINLIRFVYNRIRFVRSKITLVWRLVELGKPFENPYVSGKEG